MWLTVYIDIYNIHTLYCHHKVLHKYGVLYAYIAMQVPLIPESSIIPWYAVTHAYLNKSSHWWISTIRLGMSRYQRGYKMGRNDRDIFYATR
jgi:hypothetical protein